MSVPAFAITITLDQEFDGNSVGTTNFGTVEITQHGLNSVDFTVTANTANLSGGDIHELYFNLGPNNVGLQVSNEGGISSKTIGSFEIESPLSVQGGAGAAFEWGVNFGNGGGKKGNGILTEATFTLSADNPLLVDHFIFQASNPNNTSPVFVAVHFQSTDIFDATSETVGGIHAPESSTILLLGTGLVGLFGYRWWWRKQAA